MLIFTEYNSHIFCINNSYLHRKYVNYILCELYSMWIIRFIFIVEEWWKYWYFSCSEIRTSRASTTSYCICYRSSAIFEVNTQQQSRESRRRHIALQLRACTLSSWIGVCDVCVSSRFLKRKTSFGNSTVSCQVHVRGSLSFCLSLGPSFSLSRIYICTLSLSSFLLAFPLSIYRSPLSTYLCIYPYIHLSV